MSNGSHDMTHWQMSFLPNVDGKSSKLAIISRQTADHWKRRSHPKNDDQITRALPGAPTWKLKGLQSFNVSCQQFKKHGKLWKVESHGYNARKDIYPRLNYVIGMKLDEKKLHVMIAGLSLDITSNVTRSPARYWTSTLHLLLPTSWLLFHAL